MQLLQGLRSFIICLKDNKLHGGKVCKSFDTIASSGMLSIKIINKNIKNLPWFVRERFKRCYDLEITHVRKAKGINFAWIVATSPKQVTHI